MSGIRTFVVRVLARLVQLALAPAPGQLRPAVIPCRSTREANVGRNSIVECSEWLRCTTGWTLFGLVLALASGLVAPGAAEAATQIVDVGHNDGTMAIGAPQQRRVARDADGYWYAVWVQKNGTKWEVRLSRSNDRKGASWATPVTLAGASAIINNDSAANHYHPTIDIDPTGRVLHLAWIKSTEGVLYSKCTNLSGWNVGSNWKRINNAAGYDQAAYNAQAGTSAATAPSLAVDSSGNVHLAYIDSWDYPYQPMYAYATTGWGSVAVHRRHSRRRFQIPGDRGGLEQPRPRHLHDVQHRDLGLRPGLPRPD